MFSAKICSTQCRNYRHTTSLLHRKGSSEGTPLIKWLTCYTSALCSPAFDCLYFLQFLIEGDFLKIAKFNSRQQKNSFSQSQKLVPAKPKLYSRKNWVLDGKGSAKFWLNHNRLTVSFLKFSVSRSLDFSASKSRNLHSFDQAVSGSQSFC